MNDSELDTRLREHGTAWREANAERPGIDWDAVTSQRHSRNWFAVAGISAGAAAIVVALVLGAAGVFTRSTSPANGNAPTPAMSGAPLNFYAISRGAVWSMNFPTAHWGQTGTSNSAGTGHPIALGVANDIKTGYVRTAYAAFDIANCRTTIERHHLGNGQSSLSGGATIAGHAAATPMAVSPDGTKLALVVSVPTLSSQSRQGSPDCSGPEQIVVVDLRDHSARRWSSVAAVNAVSALHWASDGRSLSFIATYAPGVVSTIQVLDTFAPGRSYQSAKVLVSSPAAFNGGVFWWHGQWAWIVNGSLHAVTGPNGVGKVLATGFPINTTIASVSSDPTGNHLLIGVAEGHGPGPAAYRWDSGDLARVKGVWGQPGW
jgi:hypothetical protein